MVVSLSANALPFRINFLKDGTVVSADGEFLGTWDTDESDAIYEFTPDGHSKPLLCDVLLGPLCKAIEAWHKAV